MPANRSLAGVLTLWTALCVVLLVCAWPAAARSTVATAVDAALAATPAAASQSPSPPIPDVPAGETPATTEAAGGDPDTVSPLIPQPRLRAVWVAVVPGWSRDALSRQRLDPALALNPGHAPPHA